MEFKLSEARLRELAQIEAEANCTIGAGGSRKLELADRDVNGRRSNSTSSILQFEIYQDDSGQFHWRCKVNTGKIIAASTEGYVERAACEAEIRWFQQHIPSAQIMA